MYKRQHYNKTTGCVKKIDVINEKLMMIDGNEIAFKHIKEIQGDFFLSIMVKCNFISIYHHKPVSYTHLDVYKRQVLKRPYVLLFLLL